MIFRSAQEGLLIIPLNGIDRTSFYGSRLLNGTRGLNSSGSSVFHDSK